MPPTTTAPKAAPRVDLSERALARPPSSAGDIRALFGDERIAAQLARVLPRHVTLDRMLKVAVSCITKTPDLLKCSQISLVQSLMVLGELGLEPGGALGLGYLVPFRKKGGLMVCTPIIGYRGYIELARRSGQLSQIEARVVRERDKFDVAFGLTQRLEHVPSRDSNPGEVVLVYCIARLKDGGVHFEVMTRADIERIRERSKASSSGPWVTDWEAMARKTAVRQAARWLPLSPELGRAMEVDDEQLDASSLSLVPRAGSATIDAEPADIPGAEAYDPVTGEVVDESAAETDAQGAGEGGEAASEAPGEAVDESAAMEDELAREVERLTAAIAAAGTRPELVALGKRIQGLPGPERDALSKLYAERSAALKGGAA